MPQMGVSVAEGTIVGWRARSATGSRPTQTICEISTDKIDTEVPGAGRRRRGRDPRRGRRDGRGRDGARADRRPATPAPGAPSREPPRRRPRSPGRTAPATARRRRRRARPRRYSPVVQRIAAEHGIDLLAGGRAPAAAAACASRTCSPSCDGTAPAARRRAAAAHRVPVPPDPTPQSRSRRRPPVAPAAARRTLSRMRRADRRAHEALARDRRDVHDLDRGRHEPRRGGPRAARAHRAAVRRRARRSTRCASTRRSTRRSRASSYTRHDDVNLGIAVSLGEDGLIVPVIHGAHELSVEGLAARIKDLRPARPGARADARRRPRRHVHDHQPGPVRLDHGHADHQPAAGRRSSTSRRSSSGRWSSPTPAATTRSRSARSRSSACRWDHRALDGALAAQFLASVQAPSGGTCRR